MIYKCPKCGGQVKEGVRFCKSCGQEFKWPQVTEPNFNAEKSSKNTSISTTPGDVEAMSNDVASTIVSNVVNQETNEMVSVKVRHRSEISRALLAKILIFVAFLSGESVTIYLLDGSENEWVLWIEIILNIIILLVNLLALFGNKIDSKVKKVVIVVSLLLCTVNIIYSVTKISSILFVAANIFMLKTNANKKSNSEKILRRPNQ